MNPKLTIVSALALLAPMAAPALASAQDWSGGGYGYPPPITAPRSYTELRITPPPGGQVYVYEGHRLLGRFIRAGSMMVTSGRHYRVVAMRGDTQVWAGNVTAVGAPLELSWAALPRYREPIAPPPFGSSAPPRLYEAPAPFGYPAPPRPYEAPPRPYEAPPRYEEAPPAYAPGGYTAPIIHSADLRSLLNELDTAPDDQDRLDAVAEAASRYSFAVPQADWILGRFRSDAYRLAALERLRDRLVDPGDAPILLQRFRSPAARHQAQGMLGW